MKKVILVFLSIIYILSLIGCSRSTLECIQCGSDSPSSSNYCSNCGHKLATDINTQPSTSKTTITTIPIETKPTNSTEKIWYVGDYESDPLYKEIFKIATCTDPDKLLNLLKQLYKEDGIHYLKFESEEKINMEGQTYIGYAEPYDDFICYSCGIYNSQVGSLPCETDTYLFFKPYNETPIFIMDAYGSYITHKYDVHHNQEDDIITHSVSSFVLTDLFLSRYGYINTDAEGKSYIKAGVEAIDQYVEFENLLSKHTQAFPYN